MTLYQLLTEAAKQKGLNDEEIEEAHAFAKSIVEAAGGDDQKVSQSELSPTDERYYRDLITASMGRGDGKANRNTYPPTRPQ